MEKKNFKGIIDGKEYTDEVSFDEAVKNLDWSNSKHNISYCESESKCECGCNKNDEQCKCQGQGQCNCKKEEKHEEELKQIEKLEKEMVEIEKQIETIYDEEKSMVEKFEQLEREKSNLNKSKLEKRSSIKTLKYKIGNDDLQKKDYSDFFNDLFLPFFML